MIIAVIDAFKLHVLVSVNIFTRVTVTTMQLYVNTFIKSIPVIVVATLPQI